MIKLHILVCAFRQTIYTFKNYRIVAVISKKKHMMYPDSWHDNSSGLISKTQACICYLSYV
jgi:hypothetical protein